MKVKYEKGSRCLLVDEVGPVQRGEEVEVSDELGRQLVAQGWTEIKSQKAVPAPVTTTPVEKEKK